MAKNHIPEVGAWYLNINNQFLRIWGVIYEQGVAKKLVLQYLNGSRATINLNQWSELELVRYPAQTKQHRDAQERRS